ncbi:MAG: DNA repair protein RecO [Terriglobia bacterium]
MPLRETEAIVLRTYRLGEADKIVSLFSRQMGRLRAVASGAQRTKSRYGGVLEPLTYIQLWLYERENRDLLRINSAELIESFFVMQGDYAVHLAAQYVAEASDCLLPEREANERAFRLLLAVLRGLKAGGTAKGSIDRPLAYFNYWLLKLGGFLPQLDRCAACGRTLGNEAVYYGGGALRVVCSRCRSGSEYHQVGAKALALGEGIRRLPLEKWMAQEEPADAIHEARLLFETWVEAVAEKKLVTRELLAQEDERL